MYGEDVGRVESASPCAVRIAMEPLLCKLKDHLSGLSLPGSSNLDHPPIPTPAQPLLVFSQQAREMFSICRSPCPCVKRPHLNGLTGQIMNPCW